MYNTSKSKSDRGKRLVAIALLFLGFSLQSAFPIPFTSAGGVIAIVMGGCFVIIRYLQISMDSTRLKVHYFERYILLISLLPFYSAWRALDVFKQPFIYGVLTQRYVWIAGCSLLLFHLLRRKWLATSTVEHALLSLGWLWLAYSSLLVLFVNPANFVAKYPAIVASAGSGGYHYKFEILPLVFNGLYYSVRGMLRRTAFDYLRAAPFIFYFVVIAEKRSQILAFGLALLIVAVKYFNAKRSILLMVKGFVAGVLLLSVVYAVNPSYQQGFVTKFSDAMMVVMTGEQGDDTSANARIIETRMAMPYIQSNWLLGNGDISSQWRRGYLGVMGYFYPTDIGIIGALFVYGLFGLLVLYAQFVFLLRRQPSLRHISSPYLWVSINGVLFILLIQSFIRGGIVFMPAITLMFIAVLEWMRLDASSDGRSSAIFLSREMKSNEKPSR